MSDPFMSVEEAANRVRLSPASLNRMRVAGDGPPFIKISAQRVIYDRDELDTWARSRSYRSTSEYVAA